jgi:predicted GNAT family N-acyltransferase
MESASAAIDHVVSWGSRTHVFIVEQEYLGRFNADMTDWTAYRERLLAAEPGRVRVIRLEKLPVADIGGVVFQRIDRIVAEAQAALRSDKLQGAALLRALRKARAEIAWGNRTLESMQPVADWFAT